MAVYIDVLIVLNLYINFFLIRSTALITRRDCYTKRCLLSAAVGAVGSLVILLPELPFLVIAFEKLILGGIMVFVAFGKQKPADYAVCALFFLVVSFSFAGLMMALWTFISPLGMVFTNGVAYFDIPLAAIAAFTAAAYFTVKLVRYLTDRRLRCSKICSVKITVNGSEITLRGLPDTGNGLCDIITGKPVIICYFDKVLEIAPQNVRDYLNGTIGDGIRLVPLKTVSSDALIPVFKADKITIDGKSASAIIGVTKNPMQTEIDCIFNPKIIQI